ncbi:hypothetical protein EGW08_016569 [Elysia chlorotica]|uniref:LolA-like domain-containing protein n=1 Tax=Elysia chlorotica TaxID=188477 RepID=A0A433T293_ELYCH|nr:hypothetical protein EGW08_016569 [Elysia chlorotica]
MWRHIPGSLLMLALTSSLLGLGVSTQFDKDWCDDFIRGNTDFADIKSGPFFPRTFSAVTETKGHVNISDGFTLYSRSEIHFSEYRGQMSVQTTSLTDHFSAFVDSRLNVCLLHHERNGHCVKTTRPCEVIAQLVSSVRLKEGKVSLKSARESLGWDPRWFKTTVKLEEANIRGISSVGYYACQSIEGSTDTIMSQWHFLDINKMKVKGNKPVLLMVRHQTGNGVSSPIQSVQIDYTDFRLMKYGDGISFFDKLESSCISSNMKEVHKAMPTLPATFSFTKETHVVQVESDKISKKLETIHYSYGTVWYDAHISSMEKDAITRKEIRVTEDFITGVRYEICKKGKWCKTFPHKSGESDGYPDGNENMDMSNEFWYTNHGTALYLGGATIRGIPCDAWRIMPDTKKHGNTRKTVTLFLATGKWLKKRQMPEKTFLPIQSIEKSDSTVKYHSYFKFKSKLSYFIPDVSPCYNTNHSAGVRLILSTSFDEKIKTNPIQFERNFRNAVLRISGMESALQVANIRARPYIACRQETRVTFKILGKTGLESKNQVTVSTSEALSKIQKAVRDGKFKVSCGFDYIEAKPDSFLLLKEGMCEDHDPYEDEQISSSNFSIGVTTGLCILLLVCGIIVGLALIFGYKRKSCKKNLKTEEDGQRPSSSTSVNRSVLGVLNMKTEEANWSWS